MIEQTLNSNIGPSIPIYYCFNTARANIKHLTKFYLGIFASLVHFSDLSNLVWGNFGIARTGPLSAFVSHINHIIRMSTEEKVIWVHAGRVVTFMTNFQVFGELFNKENICKSVGKIPTFSKSSHAAIPIRGFSRLPFPAISHSRDFNFLHKSFFYMDGGLGTWFGPNSGTMATAINRSFKWGLKKFLTNRASIAMLGGHGNLSFLCHTSGCYEQRGGLLLLKIYSNYTKFEAKLQSVSV